MILHVAFYRAPGTWLNALIRRATGSPYSHVELVLGMGRGDPLCYSSDSRALGIVRFRRMPLPPDGWDVVPVEVNEEGAGRVWAFTIQELGSPYDLWGALRFVVPWMRPSKGAWFCSELVVAALQRAGLLPGVKGWRVSPGALYKLLTNSA